MSIETPKEQFWREQQDSLRRIRTHLVSGKKSPSKSRNSLHGKRSPGLHAGHPPFGRYRRSTPPNLPRIDTPPEHDERRSRRNLRKGRYEEVPPVKPRKAFVNPPEYDSWGEESDGEDEDNLKPHPLPYPVYAPPSVVYGQPFPMFYPPPPRGAVHHQRRREKKRKSERKYQDLYRHASNRHPKESKRKGHKSKRNGPRNSQPDRYPEGYPVPLHSYPGPMGGYPVPMLNAYVMPVHTIRDEESEESSEEEVRPRHISPRRTYQIIKPLLDTSDVGDETHSFFVKYPIFADDFVNWFITDCLEEELVPDVLIDALSEVDKLPSEHPYFLPALRSCDDFLTREIEKMAEEIAMEALQGGTSRRYKTPAPYVPPRDPADVFLEELVDMSVNEMCRQLVGETIRGLAEDYLDDVMADNILNDLIDHEVYTMRDELLEEAMFDAIAEDFLDEHVIGPEVEEEATVIASDMIKHYDNKITKREMKAVKEKSGERLVDSLCLDYLLALVARQGKVWTESDFANRFMDELMGNILLQQYFFVQTNRDKTIQCKPLRKLHEKVVTDVALDVLLQQLSSSLDEDLADVDEYERGVNDGLVLQPIPAIVR